MWVDGEFGVPLKIREAQKANVHTFQQLTINSVEDTDVLPLEERQAVEVIQLLKKTPHAPCGDEFS